MRRLTYLALLLTISLVMLSTPLTAEEGDGGYAGSFLQVPIGARPTALGGAYRAVSDDGAGPLFNPAGLSTIKRPLLAFAYRALRLDRSLGYVTAIFPTRLNSALGINYLYANSGSVTARDYDGEELDWDLSMTHHNIAIVFAKQFERYLAAGARISYYYSRYWEMSTAAVGFDIGLMFYLSQLLYDREERDRVWIQDVRLGITAKNLGTSYRWNSDKYVSKYYPNQSAAEQSDVVPTELGAGLSARFFDRKVMLTGDVLKNTKQGLEVHAGGEYFLVPQFAIRAGYGDKRFTAGSGYVFKLGKQILAIDYAFSTDKADEGSEHIFSLDFML